MLCLVVRDLLEATADPGRVAGVHEVARGVFAEPARQESVLEILERQGELQETLVYVALNRVESVNVTAVQRAVDVPLKVGAATTALAIPTTATSRALGNMVAVRD